jgi:hypothetical protein
MERLLWASTEALGCGGKRGKGDDAAAAGLLVDSMGTVGQLGEWLCRAALQPPPAPRVCGAPGGPPVTARRVRLRDGRHLAYEESGVPRESARYRIVFSHGFSGSRLDSLRASQVSKQPLVSLHYSIIISSIPASPRLQSKPPVMMYSYGVGDHVAQHRVAVIRTRRKLSKQLS